MPSLGGRNMRSLCFLHSASAQGNANLYAGQLLLGVSFVVDLAANVGSMSTKWSQQSGSYLHTANLGVASPLSADDAFTTTCSVL